MAETRPSSRGGVTDCRKVAVLITHRIGPTPSRKKPRPASRGLGMMVVNAITTAATKPVTGPNAMTVPNCNRRITRVASSAPTTMPTPYIARIVPMPDAERPNCRTAYGTNTARMTNHAAPNTNCVMNTGRSSG